MEFLKKIKNSENIIRIILIMLFVFILIGQGRIGNMVNTGKIRGEAVSGINGIISQIQVLIAVCMTVMVRKKGCLTATILCCINALYLLIFGVIRSHHLSALAGVITPLITIFTCHLINFYSLKAVKAQETLEQQNQTLMQENDEITKEGEKLSRMVYNDALTGLYNKRMFYKQIGDMLEKDPDAQFTLVFTNIDNFNEINEKYSSEVGDVVLSTMGYRLHNFCGDSTVVGRVGGDEFALIIKGARTREAVSSYISDLRSEICETLSVKDKVIDLTMCVGIVMCPRDGKSAKELMDNASKALKSAQTKGESSVYFFS